MENYKEVNLKLSNKRKNVRHVAATRKIVYMRSYRSHSEDMLKLLKMLEKGRLLSRKQAAKLFDCSEKTITAWIKEWREKGHDIHYSRALQKYILKKTDKK